MAVHQLDWDHLLRPLWGQAARLEQQAYTALGKVEERARQFDQVRTPGRLAQHLAAWEGLSAEAASRVARYDDFLAIAQQVDAQFALIDLESGQLRDPVTGAQSLRHLGKHRLGKSCGKRAWMKPTRCWAPSSCGRPGQRCVRSWDVRGAAVCWRNVSTACCARHSPRGSISIRGAWNCFAFSITCILFNGANVPVIAQRNLLACSCQMTPSLCSVWHQRLARQPLTNHLRRPTRYCHLLAL